MGNRPLSILIVDDFETMRKVTASQLASLGLDKADTASDGVEALRMMEKKRYDLVISDWNMPNMTGIDLLRNVRAHDKLANTPFVMITAEAERAKIIEAIACGVSDLLVKPYAASRLGTAVEHAMNNRPRQPKPAAEVVPETAAPAAAGVVVPVTVPRQPSLLLVDDTADNLHLLSQIFTGDYRIRAAHNGQKALDICCSDTPPDLVLLDVMMPGMDGFEVARRMREHPNAENVPIIFVTAMTEADARLKGLELGAVDFVTKPIDPVTLKLRVDNFIRYVELRRQLQADYDNLMEMARLRDDVDAMTRHDLKGPLSGALGVVQSMMEHDHSLDRRQIEQLRMSEQAMLQVMNMINLSTELYKIETKRFVLHPVQIPIGDLLRRVAETARIAYSSKHLSIVVDADVDVGIDPACAMGEPTLCYSLISNLLKNACEASPPNSKVTLVSIDADPQLISISNTGAVPAAIREHFFEKFVTAGKQGGTGLGTYSARLLARAQHGDITLNVSDDDNMTTLTVTLPAAPRQPVVK
jgi:two-component system sensor histidine kinase/response regulator